MGVIKRGILGGFSGRVANVVGSSWKGIAYMKSLPLSVANPQTTGQTTQRNAFSEVVRVATITLATFIKPLWDRFAQGMSGYNDFVSKNVAVFPNGILTVPSSLRASIGTLFNPEISSAVGSASNSSVTVNFSAALGANGLGTDEVFLLIWNETQDTWFGVKPIETRLDGNALTLTIPQDLSDDMHVWLCFRRADGTLVGNSTYETFVTGA